MLKQRAEGNGQLCELSSVRVVRQPSSGITIAYVPSAQYDQWYGTQLHPLEADRYYEALARGKLPPRGLCTGVEIELAGESLPPRSVIVRRPEKLSSLEDRIRLGQVLKHELTHAHGGNELAACRSHRDYLRKQGLNGPTDKQILKSLTYGRYSFSTFRDTQEGIEGRRPGLFRTAFKWLEARYTGTRYFVSADLERAMQNNTMERTA